MPTAIELRDGKKYEIFKFIQGYSIGAKAGRAVFHGTADVLTFGLGEVIGTPVEGTFSGDEMAYEVGYDSNNWIDEVIALKNEKADSLVIDCHVIAKNKENVWTR